MRLMFLVYVRGSKSFLMDTNYRTIEKLCEYVEELEGDEADWDWLGLFSNPASMICSFEASGGREEGYSVEETITAIARLLKILLEHGSRWRASPDWPDFMGSPTWLEESLRDLLGAVKGLPAGSRIKSLVQDN